MTILVQIRENPSWRHSSCCLLPRLFWFVTWKGHRWSSSPSSLAITIGRSDFTGDNLCDSINWLIANDVDIHSRIWLWHIRQSKSSFHRTKTTGYLYEHSQSSSYLKYEKQRDDSTSESLVRRCGQQQASRFVNGPLFLFFSIRSFFSDFFFLCDDIARPTSPFEHSFLLFFVVDGTSDHHSNREQKSPSIVAVGE